MWELGRTVGTHELEVGPCAVESSFRILVSAMIMSLHLQTGHLHRWGLPTWYCPTSTASCRLSLVAANKIRLRAIAAVALYRHQCGQKLSITWALVNFIKIFFSSVCAMAVMRRVAQCRVVVVKVGGSPLWSPRPHFPLPTAHSRSIG